MIVSRVLYHSFRLRAPFCGMATWGQFHQHFMRILLPISFLQKITKPKCNIEKLGKALSYKKRARKMLMKSTHGQTKIRSCGWR
jgi:hypothetical protein